MDGAKVLSIHSAQAKATTAASGRANTGGVGDDVLAQRLAFATNGKWTNLKGGLAIMDSNGHCIGAIGVGSGTGDQDIEVASAGIAALKAVLPSKL
jgi:glc operon protein GlcG